MEFFQCCFYILLQNVKSLLSLNNSLSPRSNPNDNFSASLAHILTHVWQRIHSVFYCFSSFLIFMSLFKASPYLLFPLAHLLNLSQGKSLHSLQKSNLFLSTQHSSIQQSADQCFFLSPLHSKQRMSSILTSLFLSFLNQSAIFCAISGLSVALKISHSLHLSPQTAIIFLSYFISTSSYFLIL